MQNKELEEFEGIIISSKKYKERGAIIEVFTNIGIVTIFGTSYKSPKSKYHMLNNLFLKINLKGYLNQDNILRLKEYDVLNYSYVNNFSLKETEFLYKVIKLTRLSEKTDNSLYFLFLDYLNDVKNLNNYDTYLYFYICKILIINGIEINFNNCTRCESGEKFKTFVLEEGGLICSSCYNGEKINDLEYIRLIKIMFSNHKKNLKNIKISQMAKSDIDFILNESLGVYI